MTDEQFTIATARDADTAGTLDEWVADFLASDGSDNEELGEQLEHEYPVWFGPVEIAFDRLHRLAGPPDQPTLERLDAADIETVDAMKDSIEDGWDPPPFVATWQSDHLRLEDGNHRVEGLRRAGATAYWCVVGANSHDDRDAALAEIER